jgi:hypothetical protein
MIEEVERLRERSAPFKAVQANQVEEEGGQEGVDGLEPPSGRIR